MYARFLYVIFLLGSQVATFHLYPTVDPDSLAKSFGISADCLDALNTTVNCDQDLFQWADSVDNYLWSESNVADLCTSDCTQSAQQWNADVQNRCTNENMAVFGKMVPVDSVAGRYSEGLNIACLQPDLTSNFSISNSSESTWCLIESQGWVGSDVIRPNCDNNSTDPSCSDPTNISPENERIANLYDNTMLCSDCFLKMLHQRMASPYLPDQDYSDYLAAQYQDIIDVCNATLPDLIIRAPPEYSDAPPPPPRPFSGTNGTTFTNGTCSGQMIESGFSQKGCDELSQKYSVTTGDLQAATGNDDCAMTTLVCVPDACTLKQVSAGATCESLASSFSTKLNLTTVQVTTLQFLTWNPNINGLCDSLKEGDYVCASAPGGSYILPPALAGDTNASGQARGGGDGGTITNTTSTSPSSANMTLATSASPSSANVTLPSSDSTSPTPTGGVSAAPSPTQTGILSTCNKYAQAKSGDYCSKFAQDNSITTVNLYAWNTALGSGGKNCDLDFWANYYYCVGVDG